MAGNLGWDKAIQQVLQVANGQLHYKEIAEEIQKSGLRNSLGATPANTVNSIINRSINEDPKTPYVRTAAGIYALKSVIANLGQSPSAQVKLEEVKPTGLIHSFGRRCQQIVLVRTLF